MGQACLYCKSIQLGTAWRHRGQSVCCTPDNWHGAKPKLGPQVAPTTASAAVPLVHVPHMQTSQRLQMNALNPIDTHPLPISCSMWASAVAKPSLLLALCVSSSSAVPQQPQQQAASEVCANVQLEPPAQVSRGLSSALLRAYDTVISKGSKQGVMHAAPKGGPQVGLPVLQKTVNGRW